MTRDLHREPWKVPVPGPTPADPEGSAHTIVHPANALLPPSIDLETTHKQAAQTLVQ